LALIEPVILDFNKSIMKYPNIKRSAGGASTDLKPDLQHPEYPLAILKDQKEPHIGRRRRPIPTDEKATTAVGKERRIFF
jgi:hypothetical protein